MNPQITGLDLLAYNDIHVKANDLSRAQGVTLIALAHNEMYFLPTFLEHYRKLGVERFIVLDDASTDGTLVYLSAQPDVMVVGSHRRYGEQVPVVNRSDATGQTVEQRRMVHVWRMILPEIFCLNQWVVQAAVDELLVLPPDTTLNTIFAEFEGADFDAIRGTMLDIYPSDILTMRRQSHEDAFRLEDEWFFDAEPHVRLLDDGDIKRIYHGSRARLTNEYLTLPSMSWPKRILHHAETFRRILRGHAACSGVNGTDKFSLIRWRTGAWLESAHRISLKKSRSHLLPILHLKFTGDLYRRAQVALRDKSYYKGSAGYELLERLLYAMEREKTSFLYSKSARVNDIEAYRRSRTLVGF